MHSAAGPLMTSGKEQDGPELPSELGRLSSLIDEKPEVFASGDRDIQDAALAAAKYTFDLTLKSESRAQPHLKELLQSIELAQARARARSADRTGKKQTASLSHAILNETPLSSLFVDGMDEEQVWAQLELKAKNMCETLEHAFDAGDMDARKMRGSDSDSDSDEENELDSDDLKELENMEGVEAGGWNMDDDDDDSDSAEEEDLEENVTELRDPSSEEEDIDEEDNSMDLDAGPSSGFSRRRHGKRHAELDDGFFSLADFNAEIEEAESKNVSRGSLSKGSDDEDSEEDNDVDFFAPVNDSEPLDEGLDEDGGEAYYKDFFEPPPKPARPAKRKADTSPSPSEPTKSSKVRFNDQVKVKTIKSKGKGRPLSSVDLWTGEELDEDDEEDEDSMGKGFNLEDKSVPEEGESDLEFGTESGSEESDQGREAVERLKDDLFADDDDAPKSGLSTHEVRMDALRKQIAELEAENVGKKDWVLKGEVSSRARPQNALLEEDLEFERLMKTVPVVTDEVVQDLEARIKARIIEERFDDVVRKRAVDDKPFLPSRIFELQDTKSKESLAQIYENEYMASQTGGTTDDRDGKLQKEHEEIEKLWEGICYKLDALCNAHFTPKQPKATISTVSNVSAISLESALPTAKAASTILAPEEVFAPSTSDLRSKSELTPAEKQALRSKERKKRKKQREVLDKSVDKFAKLKGVKGVKKQKEAALKSVVKNGKGVTVIGKKSQNLKKGKRQNS